MSPIPSGNVLPFLARVGLWLILSVVKIAPLLLTLVLLGLAPRRGLAGNAPSWSWHEAGTEIYSPAFSSGGQELVIVRKKHIADFHEAEELPEAERKKQSAPIEKNERYADPEVVILKIGAKNADRVDWGWSPAFSPDGRQVVYAYQKKPISRFRVLAETQSGNDIRLFERQTKAIKILATPTSGYLDDPIFSPDGKRVIYSLADAVNGAWGGNVGIGQVSIDGTGNEVLYPATKDFELFHLVDSKRFVGDRLFAFRSKPTSGGVHLAETYLYELLDIGPPVKSVYTWPAEKGSEEPMRFGANAKGELLIFDHGWRPLSEPASNDAKSASASESRGALSPDGRLCGVATDSGLEIREFSTRKLVKTIKLRGQIRGLTWSPDSRRFAIVTSLDQKGRGEIFDYDEITVYEL